MCKERKGNKIAAVCLSSNLQQQDSQKKAAETNSLICSILSFFTSSYVRGKGRKFAEESHVFTKVFGCSLILNAFITFQLQLLSFLFRSLPQSYKASAECFDLSSSTPSAPSQGVKGKGSNITAFAQALQQRFNHAYTHSLTEDSPKCLQTAQIFH